MNLNLERILEYKNTIKQKGEQVLIEGFPKTIVQLNEILENPIFKKRSFEDIHQKFESCTPPPSNVDPCLPPPLKRTRYSNHTPEDINNNNCCSAPGLVSCNKHVTDMIDRVRPHMLKFLEDARMMKVWICLLVPKVEGGGSSLGLDIQAQTIVLLKYLEQIGVDFFNSFPGYYEARAEAIATLMKYPFVEDYKRAVDELDEKEYMGQCDCLIQIRDSYLTLHDVLLKNLERIKRPRSNLATDLLYGAA